MFCSKCGKQIDDNSGWCIYCGAQCGTVQAAKATAKKPGILIALIAVAVVAVFAIVFGFGLLRGGSGMSGTWEYIADPYAGGYDYTIELNSDGTCIIYEYGHIPYSATYTRNDDGTYVTSSLLTSTVWGSWKICKDGRDLIISGSGLSNGKRFTRVK